MRIAIVLDDVRSVHNVGSIFRTADGAGAEKIFCCGITPGPLDRFRRVRADFAKVSLGAEKFIPWEAAKDAAIVIQQLKEGGWKIFAVEQAPGSIPYSAALSLVSRDKHPKIALVAGNEVGGLSPGVLKLADAIIEIPMYGKKESLNVAVALGIVLFTFASRG